MILKLEAAKRALSGGVAEVRIVGRHASAGVADRSRMRHVAGNACVSPLSGRADCRASGAWRRAMKCKEEEIAAS